MSRSNESSLDLSRLENVRSRPDGKIIARCPACFANGSDKSGEHLVIFPSGKWGCAAHPGDREHRREIFRLVGIASEQGQDPAEIKRWKEQRQMERLKGRERDRLREVASEKLSGLVNRWRWDACEVREDSPLRLDGEQVIDPRLFLATLFHLDAIIWTGETWQSGMEHGHGRWRTVEEWQNALPEDVGPMTCPATWEPGTTSRSGTNVAITPFVVLDFDGPKGWRPANEEDLERHLAHARAIVRWLRDDLSWELAAIVWTGSKSLHAWFHHPGNECLEALREACPALGIDPGLIGHPEHPARLPGWVHARTGRLSALLWLQSAFKGR